MKKTPRTSRASTRSVKTHRAVQNGNNSASAITLAAGKVVEKKDKTFAVASLVCGLLFWLPLFNLVLGPVAVVLGILAIRRVRNNPERYTGQGMAIAGIVLGAVSVIFTIIGLYITLFRPDLLVAQ